MPHLLRWENQNFMLVLLLFLSSTVIYEIECYSISLSSQKKIIQGSRLLIPKLKINDFEEISNSDGNDIQSRDNEDRNFVRTSEVNDLDTGVADFHSVEKLPKKRTKAQIKKLKFLMMQEVEALIQDKDPSAPAKAWGNIRRLQKLHHLDGNSDYKPNISTYNSLVRAYAKSGAPDAPILAEKILNKITDMYEKTGDFDVKPTIETYTEVIDAYARSDKRDSAEKAEKILSKIMEEAAEEGNRDNNSGENSIAVTSITFDTVIRGWAKKGNREGALKAEAILEQMEYLRKSTDLPLRPTQYSFATVISAWKRIGGLESAKRAQYILDRMNQFCMTLMEEGEDEYAAQLCPDVVVYNSVIDAWACSGDPTAGTRAESLLNEMERRGIRADSITFGSVINSHAESGHINAASAAEKVLKRMESSMNNPNRSSSSIIPITQTYNQVLKAYSKSKLPGAANRAELILKHMLRSKNKNIQPDIISFSTCLDTWAKSKEPGKAERANDILHKLIILHQNTGMDNLKPNEVAYNTVLNACAFSAFTEEKEQKKALSIAVSLFNEMVKSKHVHPDAITYGMLMKCIANLVPQGLTRDKMASDLFTKCCQEGLVNKLVFDEVRRAADLIVLSRVLNDLMSKQVNKRLLRNWTVHDLPKEFSSNVKEKAKYRKVKKRSAKKQAHARSNQSNKDGVAQGKIARPSRRFTETSWQSGRDL